MTIDIDVVDYEDDTTTGADDDPSESSAGAKPQQPPPQPKIDINALAAQLAGRLQGPGQTRQQRESRAEQLFKRMVGEGHDPKVVATLFEAAGAILADKEDLWAAQNQQQSAQARQLSWSEKCWDLCEEVTTSFEGVLPALTRTEYARKVVQNMVSDLFQKDEKLKAHMAERAAEGKPPARNVMVSAVKAAVKKYAKDHDIKLNDAQPDLNLRSSKPTSQTDAQNEEQILESFNRGQLNFYRAMKSAGVNQKTALERAKNYGKS